MQSKEPNGKAKRLGYFEKVVHLHGEEFGMVKRKESELAILEGVLGLQRTTP
jgi:hypothetical protein